MMNHVCGPRSPSLPTPFRETKALAHETGVSLTHAANDFPRARLDRHAGSSPRPRYPEEVADLGEPRVNLGHAPAIAARSEDDETLPKLKQRK